jgi:hypothetical protein
MISRYQKELDKTAVQWNNGSILAPIDYHGNMPHRILQRKQAQAG